MDRDERLNRLLLELPWLQQNRNVSIKDFARTFNLTKDQAVSDLTLLTFVGPSQFGGDLVDIQISEDYINLIDSQNHNRPVNFTPEELMVLIFAINLLSQSDASNLMIRNVLNKISRLIDSPVKSDETNFEKIIEILNQSISISKVVLLDYINGRNILKRQVKVSPLSIITKDSYKYLQCIDHQSMRVKDFRLDRILDVHLTSEDIQSSQVKVTSNKSRKISLSIPKWKKNVIEPFNLKIVEESESRLKVEFDYYDIDFVKALIYKLGKDYKILNDDSIKSTLSKLIDEDLRRLK